MTDPGLVRAAALLVPAGLVAIAAAARGQRIGAADRRGALVALLGVLPGLVLVNLAAPALGWWRFAPAPGAFHGVPLDLLAGWALLWGPFAFLVLPRLPVPVVAALLAWLDLLVMPMLAPVVELGAGWLAGEAAALLTGLLPGLALGRWTRDRRCLAGRVLLQVWVFAVLLAGLLPAVILEATGGSLAAVRERPAWWNGLLLQLLVVPAMVGLGAVHELARRGRGTPLPFDPPERLVTSGLYRYVRNPMQVAQCLLLAGMGAFLASPALAAAALVALAYGIGLAAWDEDVDLRLRCGGAWRAYRAAVRPWWPRWRPHAEGAAVLYVAEGCLPCSEVAAWFRARHPVGLAVAAAEDHPGRDLGRITYDPGDGSPEERGVAALGRGLEHLHLGWALAGTAMRLPVVRPLLQLLADAAGPGPRPVPRRAAGPAPG